MSNSDDDQSYIDTEEDIQEQENNPECNHYYYRY